MKRNIQRKFHLVMWLELDRYQRLCVIPVSGRSTGSCIHDLQQLASDSGHKWALLIVIDQDDNNSRHSPPDLFSHESETLDVGLVSRFSIGSGEIEIVVCMSKPGNRGYIKKPTHSLPVQSRSDVNRRDGLNRARRGGRQNSGFRKEARWNLYLQSGRGHQRCLNNSVISPRSFENGNAFLHPLPWSYSPIPTDHTGVG